MPKSKHAPALFELIDQKQKAPSSGRLEVPRWWKRGQQSPVDKPEQSKDEPSEPVPVPPESPVESAPEPPVAEPETAPVPKPVVFSSPQAVTILPDRPVTTVLGSLNGAAPVTDKIVTVERGRLHLSLNYVNIAVAAFVLLLVIVVSIQIGSMFAGKPDLVPLPERVEVTGSPELDEALGHVPYQAAVDVGHSPSPIAGQDTRRLPESAARPAAPSPAGDIVGRRVSGRNYVVIEGFQLQHREEAETAREWLARRGVRSTLEQTDRGRLVLISADGFSGRDDARPLLEKIKELGKQYKQEFASKAQYSFHDPFVMKEP
ncbi:MAG: hypothetical protein GXY44_00650 [Phycisphaerales bacterium]|nr:hypothetical protein [Phycisphaerales bacterium]